ncbi:MAG TPA: Uma2 family endonuclease [Thermoanaerobaculia bacterium]|nr:Uma2 family endonuclease [Thermoanaerobaculia bacterium]
MSKIADRGVTYEDLLDVPEQFVAEIVEGELFTSPRPAPRHAEANGSLYAQLRRRFQDGDGGPGGWWIVIEPELHLAGDALVPDIGGWRKERLLRLPETAWFEVAPDWICEVVSVKTARLDRIRKLPRYARHGIPHAWVVDPVAKSAEIYRLVSGHWSLFETHEGITMIRAEPFDGADIDLGALWIEP